MNANFTLHPQLADDCIIVGDAPLCRLLLMNDSNYPWCILVPRRQDVREVYELSEADQARLLRESTQLARAMMQIFSGDKFNVAALGNVVPQLHVHHIVRRVGDAAWPTPVWGRHPPQPYTAEARESRIAALHTALPGWSGLADR